MKKFIFSIFLILNIQNYAGVAKYLAVGVGALLSTVLGYEITQRLKPRNPQYHIVIYPVIGSMLSLFLAERFLKN
ncbi:hypothetical protein A3F66_04200 [candidate division TM6 bacterium RIFCSPHIGHO2_12_FULL_32_22]|nr:MAG: hypothetical protein A3F66_04200 [candidate division TM6 bacterium RIFCSPHIGHO2_12_FULL_32_22]